MKKIFILFVIIPIFTCGCNNKTPRETVKNYLENYRNFTNEVENNLINCINNYVLNDKIKKNYLLLFKKQFVNLNYTIKDIIYNGNKANVIVDITVFDYKDTNLSNDIEILKINFKQESLIKYTIDFKVKKENKIWKLENVTEEQIKKIMGIY